MFIFYKYITTFLKSFVIYHKKHYTKLTAHDTYCCEYLGVFSLTLVTSTYLSKLIYTFTANELI